MTPEWWTNWGKFAVTGLAIITFWLTLLKWAVPNFRSFIFSILSDPKEGLPLLRRAIDTCYEEELKQGAAMAEATDDLLGRVDALELSRDAHSADISKIRAVSDGVPELSRILTEIKNGNAAFAARFDTSMAQFTEELTRVREGVARMEGVWNGIERRRNAK